MAEQETVCKRCKRPIKEEATQCEHCGYSRDHGTVWNLVGLTQILNPLGWAMLTDNLRDKKIGEPKEKKSFFGQIRKTNEEFDVGENENQDANLGVGLVLLVLMLGIMYVISWKFLVAVLVVGVVFAVAVALFA